MSHLTPEFAKRNPEAFKQGIVEHIGATTELGAAAWNLSIDQGTVKPSLFRLNPDSWVSGSSGSSSLAPPP